MKVLRLGVAALLAGMMIGPSPTLATAQAPRVLILVISPGTEWDQIVITFDQKVDQGTLRQQIRQLVGPRRIKGLEIEDSKFDNILGGESPAQTTAEFQVEGWVGRPDQPLPLQPFIDAFRDYRRFRLVYHIGGQFVFSGPHDFANRDLEVRLTAQTSSYRYQILVRNPQSPRLQVPVEGETTTTARGPGSGRTWAIIVAVILGFGVGVLVVALIKKRVSSKPASD